MNAQCGSMVLLLLAGQQVAAQNSIPITVTEVRQEELAPAIPAAGTVFSRHEAQITAGIAGRLAWIVEPGDFVEQDAPVARFDCAPLELRGEEQQALIEREQIAHHSLSREAERLEALRESFSTSATQLERTQADRDLAANALRIARVRLRQTEAELARCVATAPFAGVVTQRLRQAGEDVERAALLARMTDTQNLEVRASIPIRHLSRIKIGDQASVRFGGLSIEARIRTLVPAADPQSQTFELRLDLPPVASRFLAAGQLVGVALALSADSGLTVPRDAVVLHQEGAYVMRINGDDTAEQVNVEIREAQGDRVSVRGSLSPGDLVAVRGAEALSDGQPVDRTLED